MPNLQIMQQTLRQLKPELMGRYPIRSLALFGSVLRSDFTEFSDIDILVDFSQPIGIEFIDLADFLEEKLNKKVGMVSRSGIKEKYFQAIENELVYV